MVLLSGLVFVLGASVGSFLNVVADRLPKGESLVRPRSRCPACGTTLAPADMIPVLSYLLLRGRCRYCGASIPLRVLLVEAATGLLFVFFWLRYDLGPASLAHFLLAGFFLLLAIIDLEHGIIPNRLLVVGLVGAVIVTPLLTGWIDRSFLGVHGVPGAVLNSVSAAVGAFLFFFAIVFAYPEGMGWGDVKLAGLVGLLFGFPGVLVALWLGMLAGGAWGIMLLALRRKGRKDAIPFAPFIAFGAIASLLFGREMTIWYERLWGVTWP
ncbi:MAG: prepilin peptidase [Chloroflexi bacterium]|nr:prepilin peptidase [Chloroflexota bacterium]